MIKKKNILIIFIVFLVLISSVSAQSFSFGDFTGSVSDVFKSIHELLTKEWVVWGIVMILAYLFFFGTLREAAKRVKIFEGEGGQAVNTGGLMVCHSITGMIVLYLVYVQMTRGVAAFLTRMFTGFGVMGSLIFLAVIFLLARAFFIRGET